MPVGTVGQNRYQCINAKVVRYIIYIYIIRHIIKGSALGLGHWYRYTV